MNTIQDNLKKILDWMNDPQNWEKKEAAYKIAEELGVAEEVNYIIDKFQQVDMERHDLKEQGNLKYGEKR